MTFIFVAAKAPHLPEATVSMSIGGSLGRRNACVSRPGLNARS